MTRQQSFEAPTRQGAHALAARWMASHPNHKVVEDQAKSRDCWRLVLEYDDRPRPN